MTIPEKLISLEDEEHKEAISPLDFEAEDTDDTIWPYEWGSSTWRNIMREADIERHGRGLTAL